MGEQLHAEPLYIPSGGMNPDANGTASRVNEASDMVNCDVTISEVIRRPGTSLLGGIDSFVASASGDPLYDGTYFKSTSLVNNIPVWETAPGVTTGAPGAVVYYNTVTPGWEWFWGDGVISSLKYTNPSTATTPPDTGWVSVAPVDDPPPTVVLALVQPQETVLEYHKYNDPLKGTKLFAFCANQIYRFDDPAWVACIDGTISPAIPINFEQWSITNCIDRELGATVVAAASKYTKPNAAYAEAGERYLFYYDFTTELFKKLDVFTDILTSELLINAVIIGAGDIITDATGGFGPVDNFPIVTGTAYLVAEGTGVIATASTSITEETVTFDPLNLWLPVDRDDISYGINSWLDLNDGTFSVQFLNGKYTGQNIYIFYAYEDAVDYRPLYVSNYFNALVMSNTSEYLVTNDPGPGDGEWKYFPWRVRWSEQLNIQLSPQGNFQELALDDITPILAMKALETEASSTIVGPLYFYKHNSIIRGTYNQNFNLNPDLPAPFFNFEIAYSEGIEATRTITSIEGRHYFLGRNDVYMFDGVNRYSLTEDKQTGGTRVQRTIFTNLDLNNLDKCFGIYDEIRRNYMLYMKFITDTGFATHCYVYDIDLGTWRRYTTPETSAGINTDLSSGQSISALVGSIADLTGQTALLTGQIQDLLQDPRQTKSIIVAMLDYSYVYENTGGIDKAGLSNISYVSYFISRDFFGETLEEQDRTCRVYVEGCSDTIDIGISAKYTLIPGDFDQMNTLSFPSSYTRETYNPDPTAIHVRLYVQLNAANQFRWLQVFSKRQEFTNE